MQSAHESSTKNEAIRPHSWVIIFCLAIAIRLLNVAFLPSDPDTLLQEDASQYWTGSAVLLEHGSFSYDSDSGLQPQTERVPGYFVFLAGVQALFGDSLAAALIVQSIVDAITCVLIAGIAAVLSPHLALPTGILAALWPNLIIHSGMMLSDALFLFPFTSMLFAASRFIARGNPGWAAIAGLALGLALMTRTVVQLLPFLMAPAAFAIPLRHRRGIAAATLATILFLTGALLPLTPLLHRNFDQFGVIALTAQTGSHIVGWVAPLVRRAADGTPREIGSAALYADVSGQLSADGKKLEEMNPFEQSQSLTRFGLDAIVSYPFSTIVKAWANGAAVNLAAPAVAIDARVRALPHPSFDETKGDGLLGQTTNFLSQSSPAYLAVMGGGILLSVLFLGLQGYGIVALTRDAPWAAFFAALCIGYFLAINGPVGSPKYRLPFEPVLIVLSAIALRNLWARLWSLGLKRHRLGRYS
jgi:hypothetical protein